MFTLEEHTEAGTLLKEATTKIEAAQTLISDNYGSKKPVVSTLGTALGKINLVRSKMEVTAIGESRTSQNGADLSTVSNCYYGS